MYFFATLLIGWFVLRLGIGFLELLFGVTDETLDNFITYYIVIGYLVMMVLKIDTPLLDRKNNVNPLSMKRIDLKLFFLDIYYALWWPYYIIKKIKK